MPERPTSTPSGSGKPSVPSAGTRRPEAPATAKPAGPPGAKPAGPPAGRPAGPPGAKAPALPGRKPPARKPTVEEIKVESQNLRGPLPASLRDGGDHFDEAGKQLLKFHGIYQQDDRDNRQDGRSYSFMIRCRLPGGKLTAEQYLAHDDIADEYANGTLRITTRQAFQFHGVLKGDLRPTIQRLNDRLVTSLAACGDVVRNVVNSPAPYDSPLYRALDETTRQLSDHLLPRTRAYHEIWIDGEVVYDGRETADEIEPIYGKTYLPRKFKIAVAAPGDNSVDVYTQDVGLVAIERDGALRGFNVLVGGGLGMTHRKPDTFPRLADLLAFVTPEEVLDVVTAIVEVQRDHGDRTDRRHARMKYLIHDWGLPRFQAEVERRLGRPLREPEAMPPFNLDLYHGWHAQGDGRWFLGLSIENGRIADQEDRRLKTGIRAVVERFGTNVRLTPNQDLLFTDVRPEDRFEIDALLDAHGIRHAETLSTVRRHAMACPALPTCGLAITEAERVLPTLVDELEAELAALGLADEVLTVRMTGCPNGCARPYVADIGFVGRSLDQYTIFLGGRSDGTRLNQPFLDLIPFGEIVPTLRPIFLHFREHRSPGERFGDYCHRLGIDALQSLTQQTSANVVNS